MFPKPRNSENQTRANFTDTPPTPQGGTLAVLTERDIFRVLADKVDAFRKIAVDWHFNSHATPAKNLARAAEALYNPSHSYLIMIDDGYWA